MERSGDGGGEELEGATDGSRVALLERMVFDEESRVVLLVDEFASGFRLVSVGADTPQSVLPLEAAFGRSLQWSA